MNDVILFGRSLGTGVATYLASLNESPYALILVSPFSTIKKVASDRFSQLIGMMVAEHFNNDEAIKNV